MRGRDGRPHAQRTGEEFFRRMRQYYQKRPAPGGLKPFDDLDRYKKLEEDKLARQKAKCESNIFKHCVFHILGFVGRGEHSRFAMSKMIENHGGCTCFVITASTTHVVTRSLCQRRTELLARWVESRKLILVLPEYIRACVEARKLLPPEKFAPETALLSRKTTIESFFGSAKNEDGNGDEEEE